MSKKPSDILWDLWCAISIVGIWPRYIEPKLLESTSLTLSLPIKKEIKAAVFSDLHFHEGVSPKYLKKIESKVSLFKPDLVLFLGDFLCDGHMVCPKELEAFLNVFKNYPCYAVLGNHDYESTVSINSMGDYDIVERKSVYREGLERLFFKKELTARISERAKNVAPSEVLIDLLKRTPFRLLNNETVTIELKGEKINITGLGEYMLGKADAEKAFKNYDPKAPGLILVHNPDMAPRLHEQPGNIIFCGHTHGGQVNLPWIWKKLTIMENYRYKTGHVKDPKKDVYITRGVGSTKPFRWNAFPELLLATLRPE
jgi:predicted MPP superfamily phosphohydrolase